MVDSNKNSRKWFNWTILILVLIVFLTFNLPFRTPLIMGFIAAGLTFPIYFKLQQRWWSFIPPIPKTISALITVFGIFGILILGFNFLTLQLVSEVPDLLNQAYQTVLKTPENKVLVDLVESAGYTKKDLELAVDELQKNIQNEDQRLNRVLAGENLNLVWNFARGVVDLLVDQLVNWVLFFLAWYHGLVHGRNWVNSLLSLLPFQKQEEDLVKGYLVHGIRNVLYANLLSGIVHTLATFVIMSVFGLPNVYLVSLFAFWVGFLPASPSEISYIIPVGLLFFENFWLAIIVALISEAIILWVNYFLIPKVILSGGDGNPLFVITSILTGISLFGLMGFLIGPIIMILLNTFWKIAFDKVHMVKDKTQISRYAQKPKFMEIFSSSSNPPKLDKA